MIKYRPVRRTLSASLKEEQIFATMDELLQFIAEKSRLLFNFIGRDATPQIIVTDPDGDDPRIGWKKVQSIYVGHVCVGFCGE